MNGRVPESGLPVAKMPPAAPSPFTITAPEQQVSIGVAETPAGQRLAIQVTTLLDAAAAKQLADAIGQAAGSMPSSRIVLANGVLAQ